MGAGSTLLGLLCWALEWALGTSFRKIGWEMNKRGNWDDPYFCNNLLPSGPLSLVSPSSSPFYQVTPFSAPFCVCPQHPPCLTALARRGGILRLDSFTRGPGQGLAQLRDSRTYYSLCTWKKDFSADLALYQQGVSVTEIWMRGDISVCCKKKKMNQAQALPSIAMVEMSSWGPKTTTRDWFPTPPHHLVL